MGNPALNEGSTFVDLIFLGLQRWPDREAIVDTNARLSYAELEQRILRFADVFNQAGLKKGDGIAQLSSNRIDTFITMAAALACGIRYTPLHPMGSLDDQLFILQDAEVSAVVIDTVAFAERGEQLQQNADSTPQFYTLGAANFGENLMALAETAAARRLSEMPTAGDIAWVTYTGGTTGKPKGVVLTHGAMAAKSLISMAEWQWPEQIRYLASAPISHAAGFLIIPTLLNGGTVFLTAGFDVDQVIDLVEQQGVNTLFCVPTMLYLLIDHPRTAKADLSNIETIIYASAPMSPTRLAEALELFGPVFFQCYGQTECIHVTALRKEDHRLEQPELLASCGRPPAGIKLTLRDASGDEVPQGEVGEVCIRGLPVMQGYWKRPEQTAEVFKDGWLHTGDLAYQNTEGYFFLVDRVKDMIISGGFNVYPREVEDVLTSHPGVSMAAVIGIPDEKWGESVLAVVVLRAGQTVTEAELMDLVRKQKGAIHTPKRIEFATEIPRTALGKADKKALRQHFWADSSRMIS